MRNYSQSRTVLAESYIHSSSNVMNNSTTSVAISDWQRTAFRPNAPHYESNGIVYIPSYPYSAIAPLPVSSFPPRHVPKLIIDGALQTQERFNFPKPQVVGSSPFTTPPPLLRSSLPSSVENTLILTVSSCERKVPCNSAVKGELDRKDTGKTTRWSVIREEEEWERSQNSKNAPLPNLEKDIISAQKVDLKEEVEFGQEVEEEDQENLDYHSNGDMKDLKEDEDEDEEDNFETTRGRYFSDERIRNLPEDPELYNE